jgi:hypothetical protein
MIPKKGQFWLFLEKVAVRTSNVNCKTLVHLNKIYLINTKTNTHEQNTYLSGIGINLPYNEHSSSSAADE